MISGRDLFGRELVEIGRKHSNVVVIDAGVSTSTKTCYFANLFPNRFFNLGICEQNVISTAAGFSTTGYIPIVSAYAIFCIGRGWEQIRNLIARGNFRVIIVITHAGISVGKDGRSHHSIEDIAILRAIPNLTILSPSDTSQIIWMINKSLSFNGPLIIRLGRNYYPKIYNHSNFTIGKGIILKEGKDCVIFTTGTMTIISIEASNCLISKGYSIGIVDIHTLKPIDEELILSCVKKVKKVVTIEEHNIVGGLGSAISEILSEQCPKILKRIGVEDKFGMTGNPSQVLDSFKLSKEKIIVTIENFLNN